MDITPNAMPRKANPLHQQILGALVANKQTVRTEIREKRDKTGRWVESEIEIPTPTLAGNVSNFNVDRAAKRWAA